MSAHKVSIKINDDSKAECISQWEGENVNCAGRFNGDTQIHFPSVFHLNLDLVGHKKCMRAVMGSNKM